MHTDRIKQDEDMAEKRYQDYLEGAPLDLEEYDWQYGYLEGMRLRLATVQWQGFIHPNVNVIDLDEKSNELYDLHQNGSEEQIKAYFNRERRLSFGENTQDIEEEMKIMTDKQIKETNENQLFKGQTSVFDRSGDIYVERYKLDMLEHLKNKYEEKESPSCLLSELHNLEKELGKEVCVAIKKDMSITLQEDPFIHPKQKDFFCQHLFDADTAQGVTDSTDD